MRSEWNVTRAKRRRPRPFNVTHYERCPEDRGTGYVIDFDDVSTDQIPHIQWKYQRFPD